MAGRIARLMLVATIVAAGGLLALPAPGAEPSTSPAHGEAFTAAQKAFTARRYAETAARAREVLASPRKTPDDIYAAHYFLMKVAEAQRDAPGVIAGLEGMLGSGFSPGPALQNQFRTALMSAYFRQRNFGEAINHGTQLIRGGAGSPEVYSVVGQSYYQQRNFREAVRLFGGLVSDAEKAGRKPDRNQLVILQSSYDQAGNKDAAQATLEKLVRYYPTPDTWLVLLYDIKREKLDPRQKLGAYRLMESTGNLKEAADITAYAEAALIDLPAEAVRVLDDGIKAKAFAQGTDQARAERYLISSRRRADAEKPTLAKLEADARNAPSGEGLVTVGMKFFSHGDVPKAVAALKAGIAKGGLKNLADAQLTLGIAQFKAGQKGDAQQTFRAIKSQDPITQRIIKLWILHAM